MSKIYKNSSEYLRRRLFEGAGLFITVIFVMLVILNPFNSSTAPTQSPQNSATMTPPPGLPVEYEGDKAIEDLISATNSQPSSTTSLLDLPSKPAEFRSASDTESIDMKILVLVADGKEDGLQAIQQALDYSGIPYTMYKTAPQPETPSTDRLSTLLSDGKLHAYYQGVILATGQLLYSNGTNYQSALTQTEWQTLRSFEAKFGIREINWYAVPIPELGFQATVSTVDTSRTPLSVQFTTTGPISGQSVFSFYLNITNPLEIQDAWTYLAQPLSDGNTFPLLTDSNGNALAVVRNYPDGRQTLALTFDNNPDLIHSIVLSYGMLSWLTKGLFLGDHHTYLTVQPDDVFIGNYIWKAGAPCNAKFNDPSFTFYRITGNDLLAFAKWQKARQAIPTTPDLKLELPFVGIGTTGVFSPDTLTPFSQQLVNEFNWVTHTYDHTDLDAIKYDAMVAELEKNLEIANKLNLVASSNYSKHSLVTPNVSGLKNPQMLLAAYDQNIRYLVSNTSVAGYNNPAPNVGIYSTGSFGGNDYSVFLIPRHPTNLYFNVTTPAEWLSEDQCHYSAGNYGYVENYQQLLDRESQNMLIYLLKGDMDPLMFHQPNMRAYDGVHSTLSDLLDATLAKYNRYFTLPIISDGGQPISKGEPFCGDDPKCTQGAMDRLGYHMAKRTDYNAAQVTASLVHNTSITITSDKAVTVPITGLPATTTCPACSPVEIYGGQNIIYVTLNPGQPLTLAIK
jgi:hypothetical protein